MAGRATWRETSAESPLHKRNHTTADLSEAIRVIIGPWMDLDRIERPAFSISAKVMHYSTLYPNLKSSPMMPSPMMPSVYAFATHPTHQTFINKRNHYYAGLHPINLSDNNFEPDVEGVDSNGILTSAIIKCAYDGTYFRGWTAGNSELKNQLGDNSLLSNNNHHNCKTENEGDDKFQNPQHLTNHKQTRRSRTLQRKGVGFGKHGRVRTVDDTIRFTLAKLYGNVDANRITIEGCSRTDAGVHAQSLVAQFYCTKSDSSGSGISMRPNSREDTSNFLPLPFESDLSKLVFVLNRMLPPDVRVLAASPLPHLPSSTNNGGHYFVPFHPALHTSSKIYKYKFAIGPIHDPLQTQYVWHLDGSSNRAVGMNGKRFNIERALAAAALFADPEKTNAANAEPRDYGAFRSAFRGTDRGRIQSTVCKLWQCEIFPERTEQLPNWEYDGLHSTIAAGETAEKLVHSGSRLGAGNQVKRVVLQYDAPQSFTVIITGDRFLYKMIRNIVGTIVAVGCGHVELDDIRVALERGQWEGNADGSYSIGQRICAPARGLTLSKVNYPEDVGFEWLF